MARKNPPELPTQKALSRHDTTLSGYESERSEVNTSIRETIKDAQAKDNINPEAFRMVRKLQRMSDTARAAVLRQFLHMVEVLELDAQMDLFEPPRDATGANVVVAAFSKSGR